MGSRSIRAIVALCVVIVAACAPVKPTAPPPAPAPEAPAPSPLPLPPEPKPEHIALSWDSVPERVAWSRVIGWWTTNRRQVW